MKKTNGLIFRVKYDKMPEVFENGTFNPKKIGEVITCLGLGQIQFHKQ